MHNPLEDELEIVENGQHPGDVAFRVEDFSKDEEEDIDSAESTKYGIPKEEISQKPAIPLQDLNIEPEKLILELENTLNDLQFAEQSTADDEELENINQSIEVVSGLKKFIEENPEKADVFIFLVKENSEILLNKKPSPALKAAQKSSSYRFAFGRVPVIFCASLAAGLSQQFGGMQAATTLEEIFAENFMLFNILGSAVGGAFFAGLGTFLVYLVKAYTNTSRLSENEIKKLGFPESIIGYAKAMGLSYLHAFIIFFVFNIASAVSQVPLLELPAKDYGIKFAVNFAVAGGMVLVYRDTSDPLGLGYDGLTLAQIDGVLVSFPYGFAGAIKLISWLGINNSSTLQKIILALGPAVAAPITALFIAVIVLAGEAAVARAEPVVTAVAACATPVVKAVIDMTKTVAGSAFSYLQSTALTIFDTCRTGRLPRDQENYGTYQTLNNG